MAERTLNLSIPATVLDPDMRTAAIKARQLSLHGLEIPAYSPHFRLPDLSNTGRREFRHMLSSQQLDVASIHVDTGPKGLSPGADIDRLLNGIDRALETARSLSAPTLTLELGPLPEPPREVKEKPKVTPGLAGLIIIPAAPTAEPAPPPIPAKVDPVFVSQVDGALAELGRRADRYSVPIAFHSHLSSYAAIDRAIRSSGCPWFGLDLDPATALHDEWPLDEILSRLGPLVRHVRARDATKGADRRSRPAALGQGDVRWPELLSLLDEAAYHGWLTIDPTDLQDRIAAATAGVEYLRKQ